VTFYRPDWLWLMILPAVVELLLGPQANWFRARSQPA
jgi:hypothetical protein